MDTDHQPATHKPMKVPEIEIDGSFWNYRPRFQFAGAVIDSEAGLNAHLNQIMLDIIGALGFGSHLHAMLDVPIMDTAPDVMIRTQANKIVIGSLEGKKPPKGPKRNEELEKIFGSETNVAGEAFEQLCLCKIQLRTDTIGLVSTLTGFQLVSTKDLSQEGTLKLDKSVFESKQRDTNEQSPEKLKLFSHDNECRSYQQKKRAKTVTVTKREPRNGKYKNGKVSVTINKYDLTERKYFASEVLSFGRETNNVKVFKLLATFIVLCVKSLEESLRQKVDYSKACNLLVQIVDPENENFNYKQVNLEYGIQFDDTPLKEDNNFYVIHQLGYGDSGACCLACTEHSAPCVLKFFRRSEKFSKGNVDEVKAEADAEATNWNTIYGSDYSFDFVKVLQIWQRSILVMPFLRVPRDKDEREALVKGKKKSLLYEALLHFSRKGYIHNDLWWRHIGVISV